MALPLPRPGTYPSPTLGTPHASIQCAVSFKIRVRWHAGRGHPVQRRLPRTSRGRVAKGAHAPNALAGAGLGDLLGKVVARTGLRMMPTSPPPPL